MTLKYPAIPVTNSKLLLSCPPTGWKISLALTNLEQQKLFGNVNIVL